MSTTVEVLVEAFRDSGTPFIVGHPGGESVEMMEAARQRGIRFILMKQETAGLIGEERIASMKPGAVLINCARGGLVDEAALARALTEGRLSAAGIDAFAEEPPVGSPLLELEQTVVTSHMAGATIDNFASVLARGFDNASRYLNGQGLPEQDAVFVPADAATSSVARR